MSDMNDLGGGALARGYHTLSYDRLGLGKSSHGDAKNEIQSFLECRAPVGRKRVCDIPGPRRNPRRSSYSCCMADPNILAQLTRMVRNGKMPNIKTPAKVVHVGHSFGSAQ
jgi:pimeloyl-ACP methyl ester carboxylesterase